VLADLTSNREAVARKKREVKRAQEEQAGCQKQLEELQETLAKEKAATDKARAAFKDEAEAEAHRKAQADKEHEARAAKMLELTNLVNSKDTVIAELREQLRASARSALMLEEAARAPEDLRLFPNNAGPSLILHASHTTRTS
jgi:alkanesulfonate monooxygenase SsuD/methylene tetrahydromethanopterin reductase-like flavin-dependent oxidoreductase (luciferase family)